MQLSLTYFFYHSCATNLGSVCSTFPFPESGFLVICLLVYCPPPSPWTDLHESKDLLWCVSSAPTILPVTPRLSTLFVEWWKPLQNFQAVSNKKWKGVTLQQMWPRYWSDHFCTQTKRFLFQRVKLITGIHHARKTDLSYRLEILPHFPNGQGVTHELVYLDWRVGQQEGINFWGSDLRKWNLIRSQISPGQDLRWFQFCSKLCYTTRSSTLQVPFTGTLFLRNYLLSTGNAIDPPQNTKRDSSPMAVPSRWKTENNYSGKTQPLTAGSNLKVHELLVGISLIYMKHLNNWPYLLFDIRIQLDCPFF